MATARITATDDVTLPAAVREALGVGPGDRLLFLVRADGGVEVRAQTIDLRTLIGSVKTTVRGVTIERMDAGVGEGVAEAVDPPVDRSVR